MGLTPRMLSWIGRIAIAIFLVFGMANCTRLGLNYASLDIEGKPTAWPPVADEPETFLQNREMWKIRLEDHIFGPFPEGLASKRISHKVIDDNYLHGLGTLEEYIIEISGAGNTKRFTLGIAWPKTETPAPLIISQSFCGNQTAFQTAAMSPPLTPGVTDFCGSGEGSVMSRVAQLVFGRYIASPPMEQVLSRGYAYASFYTSELIPDSSGAARAMMPDFPHAERGEISGAVAGWAAGFSAALHVLENDHRIDAARTAIIGHSRSGKSALVAGSYDERIDAVIAHQAGTGGTALSRAKAGETVPEMLENYPHWFSPAYQEFDAGGAYTTPVDMHVLIALNAPTPLLIGNGRRDVWSDPNGTWRAMLEAAPVYEAAGGNSLKQDTMQTPNLDANLVFWMRPGGHSITATDWDAWLTWLDNVMPQGEEVPAAPNAASMPPT
ncbi:alpha/beta hydrolase [Henriciella sp.]|uniref:alpha/beta hydrolase family protein n=1 Tax=Henriciella sp. TaxID=1968823 RepID=UPI00260E8388|nr:alpha/beta hydrolase [Henriciella sp.]